MHKNATIACLKRYCSTSINILQHLLQHPAGGFRLHICIRYAPNFAFRRISDAKQCIATFYIKKE